MSDLHEDNLSELLGETLGYAILDSGCNITVCGQLWLKTYLDSLSNENYRSVKTVKSTVKFRFGDGQIYSSTSCVHIPVFIGSQRVILKTHVL